MSSKVWDHFKICVFDEGFATCNFCGANISRGGRSLTTSAMKKHLKRHSTEAFNMKIKDDDLDQCTSKKRVNTQINEIDLSTPSCSGSSSIGDFINLDKNSPQTSQLLCVKTLRGPQKTSAYQPTFKKYLDTKQKFLPGDKRSETLNKLIVEMIIYDNQPLMVVENKGFKNLIAYLEPRYTMVSRKLISNKIIPNMYDETYSAVKKLMEQAEYVSLTTDLWTSSANDDYMSLTVHFADKDFIARHICLEVVPFPEISHTGSNIANFIEKVLSEWGLTDKVVCIVRDNGRNIVCALNSSSFQHIPCLAHTFQLVVKDGLLNAKAVTNVISSCRRIVGHFKHSSQATKILKAAQETVGISKHKLIQDEPTRWNSTLHMLHRLLEQRPAISLAATRLNLLTEQSASQWDLIRNVVNILQIFDKATFAVSTSSVSASEIIPIVNSTLLELQKPSSEALVRGMKNDLVASLKLRYGYQEVEKHQIYSLATMLDPRLKATVFSLEESVKDAKVRLVTELQELVDVSKLATEPNVISAESKPAHGMWSLYSNIIQATPPRKTNVGLTPEDEVEGYLRESVVSPDTNVFQFWKVNSARYPRLCQLAKKYLTIPPATVFSERLFSTAGLICDKKRNRLDPDRVKMLVFLNKNYSILKNN